MRVFSILITVFLVSCSTESKKDFYIHEDVPEYLHEGIITAANRINETAGETLLSYKGITDVEYENVFLGDKYNVVYHQRKDYIGRHGSMGFAKINYLPAIKGTIGWDIFLNAEKYDFQNVDDEHIEGLHFNSIVDIEGVMVHEFMHSLGIRHSEDKDSVMYPTMEKGYDFKKRDFSQEDIKQIRDAA